MTYEMRRKLRAYVAELPGALMLAFLTAIVTIVLILILSLVLGGEQRRLTSQAVQNGQEAIDSAVVARCEIAHLVDIVKEIGVQSSNLDLSRYDNINTEGLDCHAILTQPFNPGRDYVFPEPTEAPDSGTP